MGEDIDTGQQKNSVTRRYFTKGLTILAMPTFHERVVEDPKNWSGKHELRLETAELIEERGILPYTEYTLGQKEYVGSVDLDLAETVRSLQEEGYSYQMFSALKKHPETDEYDEASLRLLDDEGKKQWHVHLWETEETEETEIFSHYEYKPEPWTLSDFSVYEGERMAEHLLPGSENYIEGQHSNELRDFILESGEYEENDKVGSAELQDPTSEISEIFYLT